jgi:hypothetical protein
MTKPKFRAYAPNGKQIVGTLEKVYGEALISYFEEASPDSLEYAGETDIWWDSKQSITRKTPSGESIVFLDEDRNEWLAGDLVLQEEPSPDPAPPAPLHALCQELADQLESVVEDLIIPEYAHTQEDRSRKLLCLVQEARAILALDS